VYPKNMAEHKLFQDERTGKLVEFISKHDKEFAMVKDAAGVVTFLSLEQLVPYDKQKGRMAKIKAPELAVPEEQAPETVVPIEDVRLNLNTAPAEQIAKRLPGVGFATAKKIVELRMSLSGERFANLKQLENIPRVNWDQLIAEDLIFIS
jgi:DNA uptake protein ComE-like DNA-binding protein